MAAVKSKTVRDYENLIGDLRKENLQLRLRLFYINGHHECPPTNFEGDESEVGDLHRQVSAEFTKHAQEIRQRDELLALERSKSADQQVAVDKLYSEKLDYEREIRNIQGKCSADGPLYHVRMDCTVSFLEKCNKRLEDTVKDLKQRVHVLEKTEVADLERELRAKAAELQALNKSNIILNEKINCLRTEKSTWTAVTNMTRSFLQLLDSSLSSGNVQAAMQAKEDFQSKLDKVAQPKTHSHGDLQQWNASLQDQVWKADLELKSKEMTIEGLNNEIAQLTSSLEASHTRCLDLEGEIRKASKLHERICIEKDKLLETSKRKLQNLEKQIQETSTLKSRQSSLESECNSLHITVREKSSFIEELLSERGKSVAETEKSLQELLLVLKQKDETIATLREKLRSGDGEQEPSVALARCEESAAQQRSLMDRSESRENLPSARFSPEGSDVLSVSVQSVTHGVPAEVAGLCHVVRELAQEAQLLPPTPQPGEDSSHGVQELTTILRKARGSGLQFSMPAESSSANGGIGDHFGEELRDPSVPQAIELLGLGGKLQQLYGALYQAEGPATSEWQKEDVVGLLDAVLEKTLQEANAATEPCGDPKDSMRDRCSLLQERVEAAHSALLSLNTSADGSGADLCRDDMLRDLSSALECVVELRNEVEALSLTMSPSRHRKHMASMDELVFAVNSSGQLVPVSIDSMEQNAVCDASVQTEEPDDDPESLKTELSKARAQVKFLQRSLKDSFSVKITESPTGPNAQPLIEIDQNLPLLSPLAGQSPRKSGLSANRRWRKQLTNQKMSEFGLSENVFELQEEIFFLVLRIEDLERQLKEHPEVLPPARRASGVPSGRPSGSPAEDACELERKNIALEQQLHQMQEVSSELLCRLEELARFLEQLLTYDGTGSLGSVTLSPEMVAKIRQLVADSKDLSVSVSQSILGSDNNSILSEHASKRSSVDRSLLSCSILSKGKKDEINVASKSSGRPELLIPPTLDDYIFMEDELKMLRERVREQTSEISNLTRRLEEERLNSPATGGGRSKRTSSASHTDTQKLEKVLRRVQHCNARLEDTLGVHKELCQKLLTSIPPEGLKDAPEPQLASLVETHAQALKKLEFRLMEMSIKNEVLQEILTERIAESGLEQCQKELECKERREEILKRAMVHKQKAKLQLEKELEECQKELQSLQEAHSVLEEDYKAAMRSSEPVPKSRQPSLEKSSAEPRDESVAQEVARLSKEVSGLSEEKGTLLQRLEALQREHEVLLESSSNKISELVTKLGPLSTQNKNQQEEIRSLMEVGDCLSREKLRLQHDLDAAFAKLDGLQVENQDLRDSVLSLRKQEGLLRESIEKAMDELQATKKISHEYKESERLVRLEKEQLSSRLEALECEKQSLYEEKQRLILEVSAGEDAVERVSNKLVSCEAECSKLRAQRSSLETELQASSDKLEESDRVAKGLKEELNATKLKLENMNSRCSLLEQELDSSKEEQRVLLRKNSELQRTLEAVGREAQQSKTFARMSLDKRQMMAVMELEDQNKNLQGTVVDLKLKLEKVSYENKSLRSELRVKEQIQAENSPASARTAESSAQFFTANSGCATAWQTPLQPGRHSGPRSQHTSPDLGIDSDPTTDHDGGAGVGSMEGFEEHWQHRMGPNWSISSVQSAPDAIGGSCPRCQQGSSAALVKHRANATYAGEQPDWPSSAQSPLKSGFPVISCTLSSPGVRMCAIVQPTDHEELKAQVDKSIYLIRKVESSVRNAIDALADFASDCTEPPQCNSLLQDVERGCQSIKACLTEIFKLICSFTIAQSPELRDDQGFEYKQLKLELNKLQEKHSQQSAELQLALEQISSFKEKKEGMERAISRQLNKTKMVLKQTKGNLIMRARDAKPDKK